MKTFKNGFNKIIRMKITKKLLKINNLFSAIFEGLNAIVKSSRKKCKEN